jgi:hypothetical protein
LGYPPVPGRLIGDTYTVEEPGSVGNTDLHTNSTCGEFEEQGMETVAVLVTAP